MTPYPTTSRQETTPTLTAPLTKDEILAYLYTHQNYAEVIGYAVDYEKRRRAELLRYVRPEEITPYGLRWDPLQVRCVLPIARQLVMARIFRKLDKGYCLEQPVETEQAVLEYLSEVRRSRARITTGENLNTTTPVGIPKDLWRNIIGFDVVKKELNLILGTNDVHGLLWGPPASSKTLAIEAILTLPGAAFAACARGQMSAPGIRRIIQQEAPRYLCLDEIDKAEPGDLDILLEILERHTLTTSQYTNRSEQKLEVQIFATANRIDRLPEALRSRLYSIEFPPYTAEQFRQVAYALLTREGQAPDIARHIADGLSVKVRDIRVARDISKMSKSMDDALLLVEQQGRKREWG